MGSSVVVLSCVGLLCCAFFAEEDLRFGVLMLVLLLVLFRLHTRIKICVSYPHYLSHPHIVRVSFISLLFNRFCYLWLLCFVLDLFFLFARIGVFTSSSESEPVSSSEERRDRFSFAVRCCWRYLVWRFLLTARFRLHLGTQQTRFQVLQSQRIPRREICGK